MAAGWMMSRRQKSSVASVSGCGTGVASAADSSASENLKNRFLERGAQNRQV